MNWMTHTILATAIASLLGTEVVRRCAVKAQMVDIPNGRSSHRLPTPRGGGLSIAVCVLGCMALLVAAFPEQRRTSIGILGGGVLVSLIGLMDDRFHLSVRFRLIAQFAATSWFLCWLGGGANVLGLDRLEPSVWAANLAISALFMVWCMNLYNFMDGLDGFAAGQAIIASAAAGLLFAIQQEALLAYTMFATLGACTGFLVWNWPPARIFMGDCGSVFLGFMFAAAVIAGSWQGSMPFAAGGLLIVVFLADASLTLFRRMMSREAWYEPHRTHAYQLVHQLGASHKQILLGSSGLFLVAGLLAFCATVWTDWATWLLVTYGIVLSVLWMLINCLFVGRNSVIDATNGVDVGGQRELALAVYLRCQWLYSRFKAWRSEMSSSDLFEEVTGVATDLGYTVSHDWLDGCGGGRCEVAGKKWILLDFNMSQREQIRQILLAIHDEVNTLDSISTELQSALASAASKTDVHPPRSKAA